jgi:hypothetical protein
MKIMNRKADVVIAKEKRLVRCLIEHAASLFLEKVKDVSNKKNYCKCAFLTGFA